MLLSVFRKREVQRMGLLEFRSKAAGGLFMMPATFKEVCRILGRPYSESGAFESDDLENVLSKLECVCVSLREEEAEAQRRWDEKNLEGKAFLSYEEEDELKRRKEMVNFSTRVFPLLEILRAAKKKNVPVMWGVP